MSVHLEALAVDDGWAALIILLLGDPHLLEGGEGSKDGSSDPDRVLPLWWSNDLDLDNGVVGGLMDAAGFHSEEGRLEESLWAAETLVANGDYLAIGKLIRLLKGGGGSSSGHLLLEVKGNIAELLLDVTDNLTLSSGSEGVATLSEDLHQVVGEFTAGKIKTDNSMGEGITFIDWDTVGDTISRVHDNTSGTARGIEGEDSLDGDIHGGHVEGLEHDLGHLLTVSLGVE